MKMQYRTFVATLALGCYSLAWAAPAGETANPARAAHQGHAAHQGQGRGVKRIALENAEGAVITLWKPDLSQSPLAAEQGRVSLRPTGLDNYHAVVAERERGGVKETVIRYEYLNGKPSGRSPAELTAALKADFEIVPDPLPRGHSRYLTGKPAAFLLRYRGGPLGGIPVTLSTSNGSALQATSDGQGRVSFDLPDDFPEVKPGREDNQPAGMQVRSEYRDGQQSYRTLLSADYHVNPRHWQSFELGLLIAAAGALAGGLSGRRLLAANAKPATPRKGVR